VNLSGSFNQRKQDTTYVKRTVETVSDLLITESLSLGGSFNHELVLPSTGKGGEIVSTSRTITAGVVINYDTRDDIISPTKGLYYRTDYRIGSKKNFTAGAGFSENQNWKVQKISVDLDLFYEMFYRQVFVTALHGRQLTSGRIELSDLYRFGGTNTLRGYRENQFWGSRLVWTNTEYRFLLTRRSFIYSFFDMGYYYLPGNNNQYIETVQQFKYGYGGGIQLETNLGHIRVSFAFGEGDSFLMGKIHIGLINEF
jgi:outer membrane protein insertion porin family